jgi:hypothetical protein
VIGRKKRIVFQKPFIAGGAEITPFAKEKSDSLSLKRSIINFLGSIVMNSFCFAATTGADLLRGSGFNENLYEGVCLNYFFNKNIF